jgi:hypothetical protein
MGMVCVRVGATLIHSHQGHSLGPRQHLRSPPQSTGHPNPRLCTALHQQVNTHEATSVIRRLRVQRRPACELQVRSAPCQVPFLG